MFTAFMSSRSESKQAAREARLAAEQEEAAKQRKQRIWALAGGSVLLAAIVVVALIVISSGGSDEGGSDNGDVAVFDGIQQSGFELGDPKAPVTMVEYADLQCPFCRQYTADVLPDLVEKYVKTGDLRMELNLLTFIGSDSETLAKAAYAAGAQDRMWQWADVAYARQEAENSGYATSDFVDRRRMRPAPTRTRSTPTAARRTSASRSPPPPRGPRTPASPRPRASRSARPAVI